MALNFATSRAPLRTHLGSSERRSGTFCQVVEGGHVRIPSHVMTRGSGASSFTIRCMKGQAILPPSPQNWNNNANGWVSPSVVPQPTGLNRNDFPVDFLFGCSTSALQIESSPAVGGRGPSTWDHFLEGGNAVDSYHRYKDDVKLLKDMGANAYRFSISWSRIFPDGLGTGQPNLEGVQYYNNLINELLRNGITPFVTLFHFDLPSALNDKYHGFLSSQIVDDYKAYADFCFRTFGDRVKHWTTINEPQIYVPYEYVTANPSGNYVTDPFTAVHNMILAHATAARLYKDTYQSTQKGEIGISLVTQWFLPFEDTRQNKEACARGLDFMVGWLVEPLVYGDYPFIMKALAREALPVFTEEQRALIKGSFDFIGVNYYSARYATAIPFTANHVYTSYDQFQHLEQTVNDKGGKPIGLKAPGSGYIYVYPQGLKETLLYLTKTYDKPKIYITENGYADERNDAIPVEMAAQDTARVKHMIDHLTAVSEALKEGANVNGFIMWALMDCMEMTQGYKARFGLNYTDYAGNPPFNRTPKLSARWLKNFLQRSRLPPPPPHHGQKEVVAPPLPLQSGNDGPLPAAAVA